MDSSFTFAEIAERTKKVRDLIAKLPCLSKNRLRKTELDIEEKIRALLINVSQFLGDKGLPQGEDASLKEGEGENAAPDYDAASELLCPLMGLASEMGLVAEEARIFETISGFPRSERVDSALTNVGEKLISDLAFCYDFAGAMEILEVLSARADNEGGLIALLRLGAFLAEKAAGKGNIELSREFIRVMRGFYENRPTGCAKDPFFAPMNEALYHLAASLAEEGRYGEAFKVYEDMEEFSGSREGYSLMIKAGLKLFLPLSKLGDDRVDDKFSDCLTPASEDPETTVLKAAVALELANEEAALQRIDSLKSVLELMESFPNQDHIDSYVIRATGALISIIISEGDKELPLAILRSLSERARGGGEVFESFVEVALQVIYSLKQSDLRYNAVKAFILTRDLAESRKDLLYLTNAFAEMLFGYAERGFFLVVHELFFIYQVETDDPEINNAWIKMGYALVKCLASENFVTDAEDILNNLKEGDGSPEMANLKTQIELFVLNSHLINEDYQKAFNFWKRRAVLSGSDKTSLRWIKAALRLVDALTDFKELPSARKVFDMVLKEASPDERITLKIYSMAMELILAYQAKGDYISAKKVFFSLPDPEGTLKLERERCEIALYLMRTFYKKGKITKALDFFHSIPLPGSGALYPVGHAKLASWLIRNLCANGRLSEAHRVYESLETLSQKVEGVDKHRVKSAFKLIMSAIKEEKAEEAFVMFKSIPSFYEPKKIRRQLSEAAEALFYLLTRKNELDKARDLLAYFKK